MPARVPAILRMATIRWRPTCVTLRMLGGHESAIVISMAHRRVADLPFENCVVGGTALRRRLFGVQWSMAARVVDAALC